MEDAKSATSLIADDLDTYQDDSLVETFLGGLQEFLDSPARVRQSFFGASCIVVSFAAESCHMVLFQSHQIVSIAHQDTLLADAGKG